MRALVLLLALAGGWEAYVHIGGVDELLLPAPSAIAQALVDDRALLWSNFAVTAREIGLGLAAALVLGLACAIAIHLWRPLRQALYPLLVTSQTIPIPIIAPLLVVWFGYELTPKIVIVALVCFFPIVVPTLDALDRTDADLRKLMRSFGASRWQTFRLVEAPAALPGLVTGAKLSLAFAAIAAILAEWSGSENGLGHLVLQALPNFETARAYAAVLILAAFSVTLFAALSLAERRLLPWAHPTHERNHPVTHRRLSRVLPAVLAALLVAAGLAACGERDEPTAGGGRSEKLDLVLDYFPNADHAGIYNAIGSGEFKKVGLDVKPRTPSDPSAPLKLLSAGRADLVISYEPELLLARAKGAKLVAIGALVQKPLTSIMSIGDKAITEPGQLEDTKIGTSGIPYQDAYLKTIVDKAGIDPDRVRTINVGFSLVPAMLTKKVDATLGAFWNVEGVELERRDRKPKILRMDEIGVPTYNELIVVAREQDVRKRGPLLRRFMRALALGHQALRSNIGGAVDELVKANPDLDRKLQRAQVKATLPVFFPEDEDRPFGFQDPAAWRRYTQWMLDNDLLANPVGANRALTNEFLPGEGI